MAHHTFSPAACKVAQRRHQFSHLAALPFANILPADPVQQAIQAEQVRFRDRLFSPP
jgi:hypothetical protein